MAERAKWAQEKALLEMTNQTLLRRISELEGEPSGREQQLRWPPGYPMRLSGENPLDHIAEDPPLRSAGLVERSALELTSFIQHHTIKQQVENAVKVFRASQEFAGKPEEVAEIPGSVKKILLDRLNVLAAGSPREARREASPSGSARGGGGGSRRQYFGYKKSWH